MQFPCEQLRRVVTAPVAERPAIHGSPASPALRCGTGRIGTDMSNLS